MSLPPEQSRSDASSGSWASGGGQSGPPPLPGSVAPGGSAGVPPIPQRGQSSGGFGTGGYPGGGASAPVGSSPYAGPTSAPTYGQGPGAFPPPGGGMPSATKEKRRHSTLAVVLWFIGGLVLGSVLTIGTLLAAGAALVASVAESSSTHTAQPFSSSSRPVLPERTTANHSVVAEVTAEGATTGEVTLIAAGGGQSGVTQPLPWHKELTLKDDELISLSGRLPFDTTGTIHCTITVDGKVVDKQEFTGPGASAHCNALIGE